MAQREDEYHEDDLEQRRERRRREDEGVGAVDFIVPTNVSGWSIASCYMGLIGFCLPFVGLVFAVPAFIFGIVALSRRRKRVNYGSVTSDIRAIIGLVLSSLAILGWGGVLIYMVVAAPRR